MSTAYDHYIHILLEPNEVIIMGKQKRDKELTIEQEWAAYAERLGAEEVQRREIEWQQYEKEKNL